MVKKVKVCGIKFSVSGARIVCLMPDSVVIKQSEHIITHNNYILRFITELYVYFDEKKIDCVIWKIIFFFKLWSSLEYLNIEEMIDRIILFTWTF